MTIVEFVDYQCPSCAQANASVDQLLSKYEVQTRLVVRMNPLINHPHARAAALAALAAAEQGRFWEMHQQLFASQTQLDEPGLLRCAKAAGLNLDRFQIDRTSEKVLALLDRDVGLAQRIGAIGTPTYFINGRKLAGAQAFGALASTVDMELARVGSLAPYLADGGLYAALVARGLDEVPGDAIAGCPGVGETIVLGRAPTRGPDGAPITIVVFTDFEEPFSKSSQITLKALEARYPGKLRIVSKQYPLAFDAHAKSAARAALAAADQGKYWELHDLLFAHAEQLEPADILAYAKQLGLDLDRFNSAWNGPETEQRLASDVAEAEALGVNGAPTFFVNGTEIVGAMPASAFEDVINNALH
ncbi:MAG: thioredoxin domain-containing protein [Deltaproteobacteria bacterium]|nr:thioredoxin domain-containing protein [Deltaproteobacteria bacterium]